MAHLTIFILSKVGEFLLEEKDSEPLDTETRRSSFIQFKKDFIQELGISFKTQIKVFEDNDDSLCAQLPMLGSVRIDWLRILDPFVLKVHINQQVDIDFKFESDRKLRSILSEVVKKYPQRYELIIKPRN